LRIGRNTGYLTAGIYSVTQTVNAPIRIRQINVVKYVVELELELSLRPFRDGKVLEQSQVRIKVPWPAQAVAPNTPEGVHRRLCP
jgi:hypothetical protein